MKYPEHIYRKFEIAEKDICGEKHYALVEVKKFLFFKWELCTQARQWRAV